MNIDRQHKMVLVHESEDGSQEWFCPVCGRHLLISWPPNYKRTVVEPGDEDAIHSGGTGGVEMGPVDTGAIESEGLFENPIESPWGGEPESAAETFELDNEDDPYLLPFARFLEEIHF